MRTADEIINEYWINPTNLLSDVPKMINEARKEAIKECAERAEIKVETDYNADGGYDYNVVNKQSILKLIDEVK